MMQLRSPLPWVGGKHYSARQIIASFPAPDSYDVYVDLFGDAAHVLLHKPPFRGHTEIYNDINGDLVNFWMHCRDHAQALEARCRSLPYSRELHYQYHASLYNGRQPLDPLERAARWFYVMRSSFAGWERASSSTGWSASALKNEARSYHSALDLFSVLQVRLQNVLIDHRDFEPVFHSYNRKRAFIYADPPYIEAEAYHHQSPFSLSDHERLAALLNASDALIALSYYPHPLLNRLYPADSWRRLTWNMPKHSQQTKAQHEQATELLLCNYAPHERLSLWTEREVSA